MSRPNFCAECGARLTRKGWRVWLRARACDDCARRAGWVAPAKPFMAIAVMVFAAFSLGRYLRPAPPPLIIQRSANSPLSDLPVDLTAASSANDASKSQQPGQPTDDTVYLCGARTQKGTPCRRRVHFAGERCYQHKGKAAIVPLEKLMVKNK